MIAQEPSNWSIKITITITIAIHLGKCLKLSEKYSTVLQAVAGGYGHLGTRPAITLVFIKTHSLLGACCPSSW